MKRAGDVKGRSRRRSKKEHDYDLRLETDSLEQLTLGRCDIEAEFVEAVTNGSVNRVRTYLDSGVDPTFTVLPKRETLLHIAVRHSTPENAASEKIVRLLLFCGLDPNAVNCNGETPLHVACKESKACHSSVQILLEAGADVNVTDYHWKETPLMALCSMPSLPSMDTVKLLVDHGTDTSALNCLGENVLHLLCKLDTSVTDLVDTCPIVNFLLERGVPCHQPNVKGKTPLCNELSSLISVLLTHLPQKKRATLLSQIIKTSECLVAGGALFDFRAHENELKVLVNVMALNRRFRSDLLPFFLSIRYVVPPREFEVMGTWIRAASMSVIREYARSKLQLEETFQDFSDNDDDYDNGVDDFVIVGNEVDRDVAFDFSHRVVDGDGDNDVSGNSPGAMSRSLPQSFSHPSPVVPGLGAQADDPIVIIYNNGDTTNQHKGLENELKWTSPPSLLVQAKMTIRECLAGRVFYLVPLLEPVLPRKHLDYIMATKQ